MADNVAVNEGSGTTVAVAADEISGVKHQRVKVQFGADGSATDVSSAAPLPVTLPDATVTTLTPPAAITGFATAANQTTAIGHLDGVEGLLTTIDADTGVIATSVDSIDDKTPALGQALAAASVPVVLPAAQITTLTPPAAITGFATESTLGAANTLLTAIQTAVEILDNAVAGNELQVDVLTLPALAAGTNNIGDVDVLSVTPPSTFYHGQTTVTTAGTEVALASSQALVVGQITIKALHGNTGWIYVGKNPVTSSTGFVLDAGESTVIMTDNLADVFIDCSVNGEGVSYHAS